MTLTATSPSLCEFLLPHAVLVLRMMSDQLMSLKTGAVPAESFCGHGPKWVEIALETSCRNAINAIMQCKNMHKKHTWTWHVMAPHMPPCCSAHRWKTISPALGEKTSPTRGKGCERVSWRALATRRVQPSKAYPHWWVMDFHCHLLGRLLNIPDTTTWSTWQNNL